MSFDSSKPYIGLSACLMGAPVRYNGGHQKNEWIREKVKEHFNSYTLCPEVLMGLGVPRESLRLKKDELTGEVRLKGVRSDKDSTDLAKRIAEKAVSQLPKDLNGFILKGRSPTCGLQRVKVYGKNNIPNPEGVGFFAQELTKQRPDLPVIEDGWLFNSAFKEHFLIRVFAHKAINELPKTVLDIQRFHQHYKFLIQAHHEASLRKLGRLAANSEKKNIEQVYNEYRAIFLQALRHQTTVGKRVNVFEHIYGFIKDKMEANEKKSVLRFLNQYKEGLISYESFMVLIMHLFEKYQSEYIQNQKFLRPFPFSL